MSGEYVQLEKPGKHIPYQTRDIVVPRFLLWRRWPPVIMYEGEPYGDTGTFNNSFRRYALNHNIYFHESHGE